MSMNRAVRRRSLRLTYVCRYVFSFTYIFIYIKSSFIIRISFNPRRDMKKRERRRQEARGFDESKHQTLSNALRTVKSDLRRCESRIHAAASKSASRRKHSRSRVYDDDDDDDDASSRHIQRLQEQLQAASLMAQELQHEVSSPTRRRRKSPSRRRRPPLGNRRRPASSRNRNSTTSRSSRRNRNVRRRGK